ncbi:MAG: nitrogen fixation protein NifH [Candidatus Caldatribacteriota bacterium]|nr:nitrogen fixation protein NifH [Candidatus Caldatribacteriota bacterium]
MDNWKSILNANPITWLLEDNNPSVRYFTLIDILEKTENDPEVRKTKEEIMKKGVVPKILAKQEEGGHWEYSQKFYTAKYKGTVWQIIILAELGADGRDDRIRKACEFIFENSQDRESNGFSMWVSAKKGGGRSTGVIPCLTGNLVYSLIKLGYLKDERVQNSIKWITTYQRFDDGIKSTPKDWPYERLVVCWGKHSCHMGVVKALKALAEIPFNQRNEEVRNTIEEGVEYLLKHHIFKRSHDLKRVSKPGWKRFGFPLMYQTDVLEILGILTRSGYHDERMQEAIDLLISKQDNQGKWKLESTFNGRFQTNIEQKGKPSKWITLNALKVLKNFYN